MYEKSCTEKDLISTWCDTHPVEWVGDSHPITLLSSLEALEKIGACSYPFMEDELRETMLQEARKLHYETLPKEGYNGVRQEIDACYNLRLNGILLTFSRQYSEFVATRLDRLEKHGMCPYPLATRYGPNEAVVQKYGRETLGITPHVDGKSHRNIISLFVLGGEGELWVCENRAGDNAVQINTTPGNLILMRANGFRGHTNTPFHFLKNIKSERYVLGVRQKIWEK